MRREMRLPTDVVVRRALGLPKSLIAVGLGLSCVRCTECTGPANAEAFPSSPVPVEETQCFYSQVYEAASLTASYPSCGFTVAFGPKGDLKHPAHGYLLQADWPEPVTTPADCTVSHTSGQAWGYRCDNRDCTQGAWERIDSWKTRSGYWNATSKSCYLGLSFSAASADYLTVQVEVSAYRGSGTSKEYRRANGHIYVYRNTGHCQVATKTPEPSPPPP
jgi:hypothetical protein